MFLIKAQQPPEGQGLLIIGASLSHSVVLLWTSNQRDAETSTWQPKTIGTDRHSCLRWNSNAHSQQASGCRSTHLTARPTGPA